MLFKVHDIIHQATVDRVMWGMSNLRIPGAISYCHPLDIDLIFLLLSHLDCLDIFHVKPTSIITSLFHMSFLYAAYNARGLILSYYCTEGTLTELGLTLFCHFGTNMITLACYFPQPVR
jgi:hypothetical protein